jgi:hypothetical protein
VQGKSVGSLHSCERQRQTIERSGTATRGFMLQVYSAITRYIFGTGTSICNVSYFRM